MDALNTEGARETFCCLLREGHRGAHQFHDSLDRVVERAPTERAAIARPTDAS
jgi:hypothetical protein